jgi:hypothetical protein
MLWSPAGDTRPTWSIDEPTDVLSLFAFSSDVIVHAKLYNQLSFANSTIHSVKGLAKLKNLCTRNPHNFTGKPDVGLVLTKSLLTAAAVSLSFDLYYYINPFE